MKTLLSVSARELWRGRRRLLLPGLTLLVAIASLFIFQGLRVQVEEGLLQEGRNRLGADIAIRSFQPFPRELLEEVRAELPEAAEFTETLRFNTMLQLGDRQESLFVGLTVVGEGYPFYQRFRIDGDLGFEDLDTETPRIFLPKDFVELNELSEGEALRLGDLDVTFAGQVLEEAAFAGGFMNFAPRVWLHQRHLQDTGLMNRPGRVFYQLAVKLPQGADALRIAEQLTQRIDDPLYRVIAFNESNRGFQLVFNQVSLFAQLIAVAALILSGLAVLGAFQNWFFERRYLIAVLRSLGAKSHQLAIIFFSATGLFSLIFSALGVAVGFLVFEVIQGPLGVLLGHELSGRTPLSHFLFCLSVGVVTPILFSLYSYLNIFEYRALLLLRAQSLDRGRLVTRLSLSVGIAIAFYLFNFFLLDSWRMAAVVSLGLVGVLLLGLVLSFAMLYLISRFRFAFAPLAWSYVSQGLLRERGVSLLSASIFFLLSFVLAVMLSMESQLQKEFEVEDSVRDSSLFVLDLGESEKNEVDALIANREGVAARWAPWVAVRWMSLNGQAVQDASPDEAFFRSEFLVTESDQLAPEERVVSGEFWQATYQGEGLPEVSLTREFAGRYGVKLGDRLGFELYGIPFEAVVSNFRLVRWTDFQPGFRIVFQKGFFEGLPFSYLGAIEAPSAEARLDLRREFSQELPVLSVLDVTPLKRELVTTMTKISQVLKGILSLLFVLGLVMLVVVTYEKMSTRWIDYATLRCLGARASWLRRLLLLELSVLVLVPAFGAALLGRAVSSVLMRYYFSLDSSLASRNEIWAAGLIVLAVLLVAWLASSSLKVLKPKVVFQHGGVL